MAWDELKPAEVKLLYYLRTLDPWGDNHREIGVTDLAKMLKYNKGTVSRALKKLDRTGWIDLEITTASVKLHTKSSTSVLMLSTDNGFLAGNGVASGSHMLPTDNGDDRQTTPLIATQHLTSETHTEQGPQIALNSLKLNKLTTHVESECSGVSVSMNEEARPDIKVPDRSMAISEKSEAVSEPKAIEKDLTSAADILRSAKKLGVNIDDRPLRQAVKQWPGRVEDAIAALEEKANRVQSPTRFLVRAIKEGWQPEAPRKNKTPGFGAWVHEGRKRALVVASQRVDGILKVLMACDRWIPYDLLQPMSWDDIAAQFGRPTQECHAC
ncbi:Mn-dependent transcriptional regulator [Leptolyngbya sp. PCC 7375]|nr:Mn-dependent transcriptional regulator [Leptolyngbya sp. PCC 7375]